VELSPRIALSSVGTSFRAWKADTASVATTVTDHAVTTAKIADGAVTTEKIADGTVVPSQMSASGSTSGQVLTSNGSRVVWGSARGGPWQGSGSSIYYNDGNVGIGTSSPSADLHVGGVNGIVFEGTAGYGTIPREGAGTRMMWFPKKSAFRVGRVYGGEWDEEGIGVYSIAMGERATASGAAGLATGSGTTASGSISTAMGDITSASGYCSTAMGFTTTASGGMSTAMGNETKAIGDYSTATGNLTTASGGSSTAMGKLTTAEGLNSTALGKGASARGTSSTAMGENTTASGPQSTAMGNHTTASGVASTAMGFLTTASGGYSTATGSYVSTNGQDGAFIIGDNSATSTVQNNHPNEFVAVFAGGYTLWSTRNLNQGVYMVANTSGWANISDRNKKENFRAIDGEDLLARIRSMSITEWNYKGADPSIRYIGPVAQEFHAAFHLNGNDSLGINSISIDGVNMAAIQALERRTSELRERTAEVAQLKARLEEVEERLTRLESALSRQEGISQLNAGPAAQSRQGER